jgi:hypothetical protein
MLTTADRTQRLEITCLGDGLVHSNNILDNEERKGRIEGNCWTEKEKNGREYYNVKVGKTMTAI